MTSRSLFPISPIEISKPLFVRCPKEFWALIPDSERSSRHSDGMAHLRDYLRHPGCYAVALVWPDYKWCVVYDDKISWFKVPAGMIKEAYFAASRGECFLHYEQRSRQTYSSGRTGN